MDTSTLLLPAQYSIWIWAPIALLTLGCMAWLAWLLRDEPDAELAVATRPLMDAELVRSRVQRRRAVARKQRKAKRVARRAELREQRRRHPRRPLADTAYGYAYAGA